MENKFLKFLKLDGLVDGVKGYVDARIQLFKLEMQEKASNVITTAIFAILVAFVGLMAVMFLSLALGYYLNTVLKSTYWGFCILGGFYLIIFIIFVVNVSKGYFHRKVRAAIFKSMVGKNIKKE